MKHTTIKTLAAISIMSMTAAHAQTFSWYKMKEDALKDTMYSVKSQGNTQEERDDKTQSRIMSQYNVYSEKKSVKEVIEERSEMAFKVGVEMNSHPSYSVTSQVAATDINGNPVVINQTNNYETSGFAITLKGTNNLSDFGFPGGKLKTKVSLGSEHIDMDVNKTVIDMDNLTIDAGLGLKAVHKESPAWDKGFHPYVNAGVDYDQGNFSASVGARMMFTKPSHYDTQVIPYAGISYKF